MSAALKQNSINHEQRKKIFALSRQAHLNNEELHYYMNEWANVSSLSEGSCSNSQAHKIIENLQSIVNIRKTPPIPFTGGGVTVKQINALNILQKILKWYDVKRINGFIGHTVGKTCIEDLTVKEASQVITGLRNMLPKNLNTIK